MIFIQRKDWIDKNSFKTDNSQIWLITRQVPRAAAGFVQDFEISSSVESEPVLPSYRAHSVSSELGSGTIMEWKGPWGTAKRPAF